MLSCKVLTVILTVLYVLEIGEVAAKPGEHWYYGRPEPGLQTQGGVWPLPWTITYTDFNHTIAPSQFQFTSPYNCDILTSAFSRYPKIMFPGSTAASGNQGSLTSLLVTVVAPCPTGVPQLGMDESYQLTVLPNNPQATLVAQEVWGALRGIETFSQLIYYPTPTTYQVRTANVTDHPRFPHRGILFDTSRHFLPIRMIKLNLDIMAQNKFNTFHWHMVDSEAFPFESLKFPDITAKGAYTPAHIYKQTEVRDVIDFARLRGIRVIVEFDTPGHMGAWGWGKPGLLSKCYNQDNTIDPYPNIIDPTKNETFQFLETFFNEVLTVFPENYIHLGGDEVKDYTQNCWLNNPEVHQYMIDHGYGNDITRLENEYFGKLLPMVQRMRNNTKIVVWQEVLDNKVDATDTIAHVWKGDTSAEQMQEMAGVTAAGHLAILSSCWYLNYIRYGHDWRMFYKCDPTGFNGTAEQKQRVLGGEACMWGELVDSTNLIPRMWPRISAVGEQLWSDRAQVMSDDAAYPRLHELRCRLLRRGYPAEPPENPSYCQVPYDVDYVFANNGATTTTAAGGSTTGGGTTPTAPPSAALRTTLAPMVAFSAIMLMICHASALFY